MTRLLKVLLIFGVCAFMGILGVGFVTDASPGPVAPWSLPFTQQWRLNSACLELYEQKRRDYNLSYPSFEVAKVTGFYSGRLGTCVAAEENEVENNFHIADVSRNFIRQSLSDPRVFGGIFTCDAAGVDNAVLSHVEKYGGHVWELPFQEWLDDFNGGLPRALKTPNRRFTKEDCKKLFDKKLAEIR